MKLLTTMALLCAASYITTTIHASEDKSLQDYYQTYHLIATEKEGELLRPTNKISLLKAIMQGSLQIVYNNNNPIIVIPHYESSADNLIEKLVLTDFRILVATVLKEKNGSFYSSLEDNKRQSIEVKNAIYRELLEEFSEFEKATDLAQAPMKKKEIELIKQNRQELLTALKSGTIAQIENAIKKPVCVKKSNLQNEKKKCDLQ
jgi:hypothetical protein